MIEPLKRFGFLIENYHIYFVEYNWLNFSFCFIILPLIFSIILLNILTSSEIKDIFLSTLDFFSILIGFLITSLIFLITFNLQKVNKRESSENLNNLLNGTENLVKKLSYHILTLITFSIVAYTIILFYPTDLIYLIREMSFRYFDFTFLFFIGHLTIIFLNILGLLGYIIKVKFAIDKKIGENETSKIQTN